MCVCACARRVQCSVAAQCLLGNHAARISFGACSVRRAHHHATGIGCTDKPSHLSEFTARTNLCWQVLKILGVDMEHLAHDAKISLLRDTSEQRIPVVIAARPTAVAADADELSGFSTS